MKSFEQIASAMYVAHWKVMDHHEFGEAVIRQPFTKIEPHVRNAWVAAARTAHKEITEVH